MKPHHWIIDVLADLQGFARQNDMPTLAQHLDQTLALAMQELARVGGADPCDTGAEGAQCRGWSSP